MSAQPDTPGPDTGSYEVIHLGGQAAVVVPVTDFLRLRALEQAATPEDLEDAEDTAAVLEWKARDAAGQTTFVPADEARRRLGMPAVSLRVDYDERAISQAAAFLDDPQGIRASPGRDRPAGRRSPTGRIVPVRVTRPATAAGRPVPGPVRDHRGRDRGPAHRSRHCGLTWPEDDPGGWCRLLRWD